ncbi:fasciclin domain-containing protein [Bordetella sp. 15P40C-2]|uniref:fasciclin domain-containing protein n=1 Tax=Bordetella sp. 15P40C-2 TaxID=2572246 RepID=UPI00132109EE|nr:fasciclin domain-containing protein [Bordetella sp. 15P40C-2]MVW70734.1 fasciclin domain-containing protein [Bordetella sp. 15P40C-2]
MKRILAGITFALALGTAKAADIVDTAQSAVSFNTLVTAVKAADLVNMLKGPGPFTVWVPTDAAFAKVPQDQLDALLKDKAALTKVLTYHVIAGKVMARDVAPGTVKTVQCSPLKISTKDGKVFVEDAQIVQTDIVTDNGVIHVIYAVVMPK